MHYYKRNLGDYAKKAGRLSMLQHGAYTLLIDACYDREQFPTRDEAIDWAWASSAAEIEAVDFVLSKFFTLVDGRYIQNRIQEEIDAFHETSRTNKRIATEREAKRNASSTERARTVNEAPPNQEPLTKNQEPRTNTPQPPKGAGLTPGFERFWSAWPNTDRKADRKKCAAKWARCGLEVKAEEIVSHVEAMKASRQWREGFEPAPLTYLNGERWADGVSVEKTDFYAGVK